MIQRVRSVARAAAVLAALFASAGCSSGTDALEQRLRGVEQELAHVRKEQARLEERLAGSELAARRASSEDKAAGVDGSGRPVLQVVRLDPGRELAPAELAEKAVAPEREAAPPVRPRIYGEGARVQSDLVDAAGRPQSSGGRKAEPLPSSP
jgi:hypothetical protein